MQIDKEKGTATITADKLLKLMMEQLFMVESLKKEVEEGYSTVNRRICDNASVVPAVFSCEENSPLRVSRERI